MYNLDSNIVKLSQNQYHKSILQVIKEAEQNYLSKICIASIYVSIPK